jgi:hypothetical protein
MEVSGRSSHVDLEIGESAERKQERGKARSEHGRVRDDHGIGRQTVFVGLDEGYEVGRPHLFLSLGQDHHVHRKGAAALELGLQGLQVEEELALVVGSPPGVEVSSSYSGFEGGGVPLVQRFGWLDVVVSVYEQSRGSLRGFSPLPEHHGMSGGLEDRRLQAGVGHAVRDPLGRVLDVTAVLAPGAHGGNSQKCEQFLVKPLHLPVDICLDL